MRVLRRSLAVFVLIGALLLVAGSTTAQTVYEWTAVVGEFSDQGNWDGFVPLAALGEIGHINNGGTAVVSDMPDPTGGVVLGDESGDSGTLEIQTGGSLVAETNDLGADGSIVVGNDGTGHLIVMGGGSLMAESLSSGSGAASSIVLGDSGAGTAAITINGLADLDRILRVVGPNVDFSAGSLNLGGTFTSVLTGTNPSTLNISGPATLGGTLHVEFDGYTPSVGDSWDLIDAASFSGSFAAVTSAFEPAAVQYFQPR